MYCVEWNTRNARPARKSRDDNRPATGRSVKPVQSTRKMSQGKGFGNNNSKGKIKVINKYISDTRALCLIGLGALC